MKIKHSMMRCTVVLMLWLVCATAANGADSEPQDMMDFKIGPGDVLDISVWKNPELTKTVIVLPDGRISFPLVGRLVAAGRTVDQLNAELRQRLNRYVPDVDLTVIVSQVNSYLVYVIGRVNNPGRFVLNTDVTVLQALAMAGGLNTFAKRGDIKVFREGDPGKYLPFDYDEVAQASDSSQNVKLHRGDVIVVP